MAVDSKIDFVAFAVHMVMVHSNLDLPFVVLYSAVADYCHSLPLDFDYVVVADVWTVVEAILLLRLASAVT